MYYIYIMLIILFIMFNIRWTVSSRYAWKKIFFLLPVKRWFVTTRDITDII